MEQAPVTDQQLIARHRVAVQTPAAPQGCLGTERATHETDETRAAPQAQRSRRTTHSERTRTTMASKPILLTVDDDPEVLRAIERDLRRHYGKDYRVLRADAGATALAVLRQVDERGEPVALFLVDQRMPQMSGVEFLEQARAVFPDAKRMLLTAYADTDAAIKAIN